MWNELVKINYNGKEFIGRIKSIESCWETIRDCWGNFEKSLRYYEVSLYDKDTWAAVGEIYINSLKEIEPYNE